MNYKKLLYYIIATILFSNPAYAYLDPGTGSMILNLIVGAAAGAITFASVFWQKIKNFFRKVLKKDTKKIK
tara:strand:+ start:655 stop:867 length:213 start_codon:yes stop_codon:yes gene_type:complete